MRGLRRRLAAPHCRYAAAELHARQWRGSGAARLVQVGDAQLVILHVELEEDGVQAPASERAASSEALAAGGGRDAGRRVWAWLVAQG